PCSSFSTALAGPDAPRLSPGLPYMARSVSLVGLAQSGVSPQNNSMPECCFMTSSTRGSRRGFACVSSPDEDESRIGRKVPKYVLRNFISGPPSKERSGLQDLNAQPKVRVWTVAK